MPDYNRAAAIYWWSMVVLGSAVLGSSFAMLSALPASALAQIAVGVALAMVAGYFPVKIPRTNVVFAAGDVMAVLLLLAHGPAAGCLAAGLESLVSGWRSSQRWTTRIGSPAITSLAMAGCGLALHLASTTLPGDFDANVGLRAVSLVVAAAVFGLAYAASSSILFTQLLRFKRSEPLVWRKLLVNFGWVGAASAGTAALAALLYTLERALGIGMLLAVLPTVALMLTSLHFFARQQEAESTARMAEAEAMQHKADLALSQARQREAEMAAQHLRALERSEQRFHSAFTHASIGMALVSDHGVVQLANPALAQLLGVDAEALVGRSFAAFLHPAVSSDCLPAMLRGHADAAPHELRCRRANGDEVWASVNCGRFSEPGAPESSFILQVQDITARQVAERELHHRAFHDKLTGLPNRDYFLRELTERIDAAREGHEPMFAVLFLDFDRFKLVNDTRGHGAGDEFLVQASARLAASLRRQDILARLGGDEFAILARDLDSFDGAIELAERLQSALREPLPAGSISVSASASIGITFSSIGYTRPEDMLRDADIAMYRAKQEGKARHALFDVALHEELSARVRLEADLREALASRSLSAAYQPIFNLGDHRLAGFEALCRWEHPTLGPVSPATFMPIAEDSPLVLDLTDFMLDTACRQLATWHAAYPGTRELHMHVNAAARDLADPMFVERVRAALGASGLDPRSLVIELTEGILMSQLTAAMDGLTALRELGVGLSVDDFGTGYSSLSHLSRLPIDSLKIDMSFVRRLARGSKDAAVVRAIVLLGTSLGKTIVAEGIETAEQAALLDDMGCHQGQGYLLSRPLVAAAVGPLLEVFAAAGSPASAATPHAPSAVQPLDAMSA